jgi:hypothetical protein
MRSLVGLITIVLASVLVDAADVDFEREIAPLLARRCLECHSGSDAKGGLRLTTRDALLHGGDEGPAVVAGKPPKSLLFERVVAGEMPPKKKGVSQALPKAEVETLRAWIAAGAPWPKDRVISPYETTTSARGGRDWWSLQPITKPTPPKPKDTSRVRGPIDAFVLSRLEAKSLTMAPEADRRTLIRRVYFDLIGLPPSPEEIDSFVEDNSADAWTRLVDRLLDSQHYGERWARYWLDLVRYADTNGYERDATKPHAWRYRDWVIRAFNDDKPYDQFLTEQLAGDEVAHRSIDTVIGTGLLRLGTWDDEPNDGFEYKYTRLQDLIHVTSTTFLGMTVKCARCHDHKFDPIPQTDYYRLGSVFWAGPIVPGAGDSMGGPSYKKLGYEVLGWTDRDRTATPLRLLYKGEAHKPRQEITPATLSFVSSLEKELEAPPPASKTTQRRLQVARWMTDPRHPLTARVFVNRIWQHHFGQGIVRTPNNFGFKGDPPTHPKLLDWLATTLVEGGWKVKRLHRMILHSSTYRMSALHPDRERLHLADSANRTLWRAQRRRLEAEALRDAMLKTSGVLNPKMGGEGFHPVISKEGLEGLSRKGKSWGSSNESERRRRSVYIFCKRSLIVPMLQTFDFCDTTQPCPKRDVTTVAPQALALLNNHFVHARSDEFALRVEKDAGKDAAQRIERTWRLAFGRSPSGEESAAALTHLREQHAHFARSSSAEAEHLALASLCHVLLNANEYVYID